MILSFNLIMGWGSLGKVHHDFGGRFFILLFIISLLLPPERVAQKKRVYKVSPAKLYEIVTNNRDYSYRSDLKEIDILETTGNFETWKEISKSGQTITFRTVKKVPPSLYEFEIIDASGFRGYWTGEFREIAPDKTEFIATEHIVFTNPVIKMLSYLLMDIGAFLETYQNDLKKKVANIQ